LGDVLTTSISKSYTIKCPVYVYVYDKANNLVAFIEEDDVYASGNITISLIEKKKIVDFYDNQEYTVVCKGYDAGTINLGDMGNWNTFNVTNMSYMFEETGYNAAPFKLSVKGWNTIRVTNSTDMFANCFKLEEITIGKNFTFANLLPIPNDEFIPESDGKWYDILTLEEFLPNEIPVGFEATYTVKAPPTFAIYSADDTTLRFYKRREIPAQGTIYNGLTATNVYTDFITQNYAADAAVPWNGVRNNVTKIVFEN
jgi:hypothetical protein